MSWWADMFAGLKKKTAGSVGAPTYKDLLARVAHLEEQIASERKTTQEKRIKVASRAQDDQVLLNRYRLALEWYAKPDSWRPRLDVTLAKAVSPVESDRGYKARKALGQTP